MTNPAPIAPPPRARHATVAIALHWVIAAGIIFQILLAWRMEDLKTPRLRPRPAAQIGGHFNSPAQPYPAWLAPGKSAAPGT